jgi:hypothetical protein
LGMPKRLGYVGQIEGCAHGEFKYCWLY